MLLLIPVAAASYQARCAAKVQVTAHERRGSSTWVTATVLSSTGPSACTVDGEHTWVMPDEPVPIGEIAELVLFYSDGVPFDGTVPVSRGTRVLEHYPKPTRCQVAAQVVALNDSERRVYMARSERTAPGCPAPIYGAVPLEPDPSMPTGEMVQIEMVDDVWSVVAPAPGPCRATVTHAQPVLRPVPSTVACNALRDELRALELDWVPGLPDVPFDIEWTGEVWRADGVVLQETTVSRPGTVQSELP